MIQFSDAIVKWLKELGYTHCFFVAGGNIMHLLNSVRSEMQCIPFVNEVGAAIAVESFNEVRNSDVGKAFLLVTAGPGLTNAVTGIAGAWLESRELLALGGQVKSTDLKTGKLRQRGIQEIDGAEIVKPITKKSVRLESPITSTEFKNLVNAGSSSRKGPVFIEICLDVQATQINESIDSNFNNPKILDSIPSLNNSELQEILNTLRKSERPVLLIGGGVKFETLRQYKNLIEKINFPIMTTWNGADRIPNNSRNYFGRPNTWGMRYSNILLQQSDLIIAVGTRLGLQQTGFAWKEFAPLAKVIHVDLDPEELKKGHPRLHLGIQADANQILKELVKSELSYSEQFDEWMEFSKNVKSLLPLNEPSNITGQDFVKPYEFGIEIAKQMSANAILVPCSSGSSFTVLMQTVQLLENQKMISSKGLASMGYGLSTAIGAWLADTNSQVFLIEGDGGLAQNLQEFGTLASNNANVKVFIWSNNGYASIRTTQKNYFNGSWIGCDSETGLGLPDWQNIAKAYGINYVKMDKSMFDDENLQKQIKSNHPLIVEVPIDPEQTFFPKITSVIQPDGSMKSNPLHLMSPELPPETSKKVLRYLNS